MKILQTNPDEKGGEGRDKIAAAAPRRDLSTEFSEGLPKREKKQEKDLTKRGSRGKIINVAASGAFFEN